MNLMAVYDAGERFADRYTAVFDNGDVFGMSFDADQPNGCCIYYGNLHADLSSDNVAANGCKVTDLSGLPQGTLRQIAFLEGGIGRKEGAAPLI